MKISRHELALVVAFALLVVALVVAFRLADRPAFGLFFSWPDGGVWSNLAASFVLGVPAVYLTLRKIARNHAEHMRTLHEHHAAVLHHLGARSE